ncbi:hypothetical protein CF327_g2984 [Tilletia walkeri]|uniref:Uncharacterized protein n=1 Tax=Tilletia walkeri TaxID=117179 RepID=A0A8X7NDZ8_9BASI|nr:hypothetical protein CF327_g2984 [Tilletia walkeri]KAE8270261.1 hypothetical protein A4X09_0g2078 [Tilletia walkeri]
MEPLSHAGANNACEGPYNSDDGSTATGENGREDAASTYKHAMRKAELEREEERVMRIIEQRQKDAGTADGADEDAAMVGDKTPPMGPPAD